MSRLAEQSRAEPQQPIGSTSWRAEMQRRQQEVLPSGRVLVSCSAPLGSGGLGRHLQEVLDGLGRSGAQVQCICGSDRPPSRPRRARRLGRRALGGALSLPPLRLAAAQRALRYSRDFDAFAAGRLPGCDHLIAFNGTALEQMRVARKAGCESASVVSATSHLRLLLRRHAQAHRQYPLEDSWARLLLKRNLNEYAETDRIYVASQYARQSFIEEGFSEELLATLPLTPEPRYGAPLASRRSSTFDIVYVGSLSVVKGVPLLIDAVRALSHAEIRLVLVGGWRSRGMRRFVEAACAQDPRITARHGDPLPHLQAARLCVHPSYNDGFAYAPAEALACGVPAIVSEDTGMKDLIDPGRNGLVVPTGELAALTEAIDAAFRGELFGG